MRNDTLSVNEVQVMKLLGFPVLLPPSQEEFTSKIDAERDKPSESEFHLSDCMQEGYVSEGLEASLEPNDAIQRENSILDQVDEDEEDNLDNISLLSGTLSIGDVSRAIGMKNPESSSEKAEVLYTSPSKYSMEQNALVLPPPQDHTSVGSAPDISSINITVDEKQIDHVVKSSIDKYLERESVINTPTIPNLIVDEHDELTNMTEFALQSDESSTTKTSHTNAEAEKILQCVDVVPSGEHCNTLLNKSGILEEHIELESTSSEYKKTGWSTICEESIGCDIRTSHFSSSGKFRQKSGISCVKPPSKPKSFKCPTKNCKLRFQRRLHYERHVGGCFAKSLSEGKPILNGDFKCEECGKFFHHPDNLKLHQKYHADLLIEKECNICGLKGIMGRHALTAHTEKFHSTKIPCPFCKKLISSRRLLNRHISRIHQKKPGTGQDSI